jgi:hypothetical protein
VRTAATATATAAAAAAATATARDGRNFFYAQIMLFIHKKS